MQGPIIMDIGCSVDDYFALALAACSPEINLIGVTTSQDEDGSRARLARLLLDAYGRTDVVVSAGPGTGRNAAFFALCLDHLKTENPYQVTPIEHDAVAQMVAHATRNTPLNLVVTGPLTNAAHLLSQHPWVTSHIDHIYFMGGWPTQAIPEHNVRLDPEAAAEVLLHDIKITAMGFEVTLGHRLMQVHLSRLEQIASPGPQILSYLHREWDRHMPTVPVAMHDPLIIAYLSGRLPVELGETKVAIKTTKGPGWGAMYQDSEHGRKIQLFTAIDSSTYINFMMQRLTKQIADSPEFTDPSRWNVHIRGAFHIRHYAGWSIADIQNDTHTLILVDRGHGEAEIDNKKHPLGPGTILYACPGEQTSFASSSGMWAFWFYFHIAEDIPGHQPRHRIPWPCHTTVPASELSLWRTMGARVVKYWPQSRLESGLMCKAAFLELIAHLFVKDQEQKISAWGSAEEAALKAKHFIEERVTKPITLDQIADHVSLSKYHLLRVFTDVFSVTPMKYHQQLRIQQAKRRLSIQHVSIQEVAAEIGYFSASGFRRAFRQETGISPSEYRNNALAGY